MANNRIFIECVGCDHEKPSYFRLAKRMGDGYYTAGPRRYTMSSDLDTWFDQHKFCGMQFTKDGVELATQDHFRLHYEDHPNTPGVEQTEILDYNAIDVEPADEEQIPLRERALERLRSIINGIDAEECRSDDGWWETSDGAEFGRTVKSALECLIRDLTAEQKPPGAGTRGRDLADSPELAAIKARCGADITEIVANPAEYYRSQQIIRDRAALLRMLEEARAENVLLRKAIKYARHEDQCSGASANLNCWCGWNEAKRGISPAPQSDTP